LTALGFGRAARFAPEETKVFCCFFSKKQRFLSAFPTPGSAIRRPGIKAPRDAE
jgi:hypothetical protein